MTDTRTDEELVRAACLDKDIQCRRFKEPVGTRYRDAMTRLISNADAEYNAAVGVGTELTRRLSERTEEVARLREVLEDIDTEGDGYVSNGVALRIHAALTPKEES